VLTWSFRIIETSSGWLSYIRINYVTNGIPISSQTEWNLVFALIRSTMSHPEAARVSFELITHLASEGPDQFVTVDNFGGLITLLDDFATSASFFVEMQQGQARPTKPLDLSK
jgi:brefeldin A-resistance guanine nucleotide exchange factor 1